MFEMSLPDRPPCTMTPLASSPCSISFGLRVLFTGKGGACTSPRWMGRLVRRGLGFVVGGLLKCLMEVTSATPLLGWSPFLLCSCLLNLLTMLFTFPSETVTMLSESSRGGEVDCIEGFGGISGLGFASGLRGMGEGPRWDASWMDIVAGCPLFCCVSLPALTNQRSGFDGKS